MFNIVEQRLCDQASAIRKNDWLPEAKVEAIRRRLGEQGQEPKQEVNDINYTEEILAQLNVEVAVNEINEAEIEI